MLARSRRYPHALIRCRNPRADVAKLPGGADCYSGSISGGSVAASQEPGVAVTRISWMEANRAQEVPGGLVDLAPVLDVRGSSPLRRLPIVQARERADRVHHVATDRRGVAIAGDLTSQRRANAQAHKQGRRSDGKSEPRLRGCMSTHDVCSLFGRRRNDGAVHTVRGARRIRVTATMGSS